MNNVEVVAKAIATQLVDNYEMISAVKSVNLDYLTRPINDPRQTKPSRKLEILKEIQAREIERSRTIAAEVTRLGSTYEGFTEQLTNKFLKIKEDRAQVRSRLEKARRHKLEMAALARPIIPSPETDAEKGAYMNA